VFLYFQEITFFIKPYLKPTQVDE